MRIAVFINQLGIGGTEKAACRWARELVARGYDVHAISLHDGPRRSELEPANIPVHIVASEPMAIKYRLQTLRPDVIHVHAPGHPHEGDVLGEALLMMPKIPVVQTNIFGQLANPRENAWTDFRLYISWTSCVQAARRHFKRLNADFFRHASVAVYPLDPDDGPPVSETRSFRHQNGIGDKDILFGRLSRPEPNKWTNLPLDAFRIALTRHLNLKLLLREPPQDVADHLRQSVDYARFIILPATDDPNELALTMGSLDAVLHTSSCGESFGYGIAEPMNYAKPVITNSTPWLDQAQIELVRHEECGFIASSPETISEAILTLANDANLRTDYGRNAQCHIRQLAGVKESTDRLEDALLAVTSGTENPRAATDLEMARAASDYLDLHQFGHGWKEQIPLRLCYYWSRLHQWRRAKLP